MSDGTNVTMSDQSLPSTAGPVRPHAVVPPLPGGSSEGPQASASGATGDANRGAVAGLPPADSLELQSTCAFIGSCVPSWGSTACRMRCLVPRCCETDVDNCMTCVQCALCRLQPEMAGWAEDPERLLREGGSLPAPNSPPNGAIADSTRFVSYTPFLASNATL